MRDDISNETDLLLKELHCLRTSGVKVISDMIGQTLTLDDLYTSSVMNRCLHLIDGFTDLVKKRNLVCAGALLRLQLDNCLRLYAIFIAEDKEAVLMSILDGNNKLSDFKDDQGKRMSDAQLKKRIGDIDSHFVEVYDQCSGYIHRSEKAFFSMARAGDKNTIGLNIGTPLDKDYDPIIYECVFAFKHYVELQFNVLCLPIAKSKQRLDAKIQD